MTLVISDLMPVQFWTDQNNSFNNKTHDGIQPACFCAPFNQTDNVVLQFQDSPGKVFQIQVTVETEDNYTGHVTPYVADTIFMVEVSPGVYQLTFNPVSYSGTISLQLQELTDTDVWTTLTLASSVLWHGVAYGLVSGTKTFVAVGHSGKISYSTNLGVTWTNLTIGTAQDWEAVIFAGGQFVAVGSNSSYNQVATSPDGITWTLRTAASTNSWKAIAYGSSIYVAVSDSGTGNRVMTSPDGITWTSRTSAANNNWLGVTWGGTKFVAVAATGTGNRVMTSPDGITWTIRTSAADKIWTGVAYGLGKYVAVGYNVGGAANTVMYSSDGITWTLGTAPTGKWRAVTFNATNSDFLAVGDSYTYGKMRSADGVNWYAITSANITDEYAVVYGFDRFMTVGFDGGLSNSGEYATTAPAIRAYSDCLDIKDSHAETQLIQFSNKIDYNNLKFVSDQVFAIRVRTKFYEERSPEENESEGVTSKVVKLSSQTRSQKLLEVEYAPFYFHKKIIAALKANTVKIDGDYWIDEESYQFTKLNDRFAYFLGKVWLTNANDLVVNVYGSSITI